MTEPYRGVFPVVPTTFTNTGALDLDSQRRVLDCMVDQGSDGICILANYSEQFLLSDAERELRVHAVARVGAPESSHGSFIAISGRKRPFRTRRRCGHSAIPSKPSYEL